MIGERLFFSIQMSTTILVTRVLPRGRAYRD